MNHPAFNRERYAQWLAGRQKSVSDFIESGVRLLEDKGPEAVYTLVLEGEHIAGMSVITEAMGGDTFTLKVCERGLSFYIDVIMKAYEKAHGPVDWLAAFERRHNKAIADAQAEEAKKAKKPSRDFSNN